MTMNLTLLYPEISLFLGALIILISDVFLGKKFKDFFYVSHLASLIFCAISLYFITQNFASKELLFNNMFLSNSFTSLVKAISVLLLTIVILMSLGFVFSIKKISGEFIALLMIATSGGMILISANDFITFYLALELQALSLYLLAAINRSSAKSSEAGIKYFILGSVASGILLFGISLIYGFAGTTNFQALMDLYHTSKDATQAGVPVAVMFGFLLVVTAMFFKVSAAPFHMWTPDVYEGSASIVTTFFATVVKFASVMVLMNLFSSLVIGWIGINKVLICAGILSIIIGSLGAIFQKNLKRLLAYSSIGHVGFALLSISSLSSLGFSSAVLYMIVYALISLGSFGFLNLIQNPDGAEVSDTSDEKIFAISSLAGLSKTNPVMAFSLSVLMFSTAGIPPFAGFFSKFYVLLAIIERMSFIAATIAVLFSVVSAFYYLRIIKIMYFDEPNHAMKLEDVGNVKLIILLTAILNLIFILFLNPIVGLINSFM